MRTVRVFILATVWLFLIAGLCIAQFPELEILYPSGNLFECSMDRIQIVGRVRCHDCKLTVGKKQVEFAQDGAFRTEVLLNPGKNIVLLNLKDIQGNIIQKTLEIRVNLPGSETGIPAPLPDITLARTTAGFEPAETAEKTSPSEPAGNLEPPSRKTRATPSARRATSQPAILIYHHGKPLIQLVSSGYIRKGKRIFIPLEDPFWVKINAHNTPDAETLVFRFGNPINELALPLGDGANLTPSPFRKNGRLYLPVRAVFERAGFMIHWRPGRIDLTGPICRPAPAVMTDTDRDVRRLDGVIYKNALFVKTDDLVSLGLRTEPGDSDGAIRVLDHNGKWVVISRRQGSEKVSVDMQDGRSVSFLINGPGKALLGDDYAIPLRAVISELGFQVEWDTVGKRARITFPGLAIG